MSHRHLNTSFFIKSLISFSFILFIFSLSTPFTQAQKKPPNSCSPCSTSACIQRSNNWFGGCNEKNCTKNANGQAIPCEFFDLAWTGNYCRPDLRYCSNNAISPQQCSGCRDITDQYDCLGKEWCNYNSEIFGGTCHARDVDKACMKYCYWLKSSLGSKQYCFNEGNDPAKSQAKCRVERDEEIAKQKGIKQIETINNPGGGPPTVVYRDVAQVIGCGDTVVRPGTGTGTGTSTECTDANKVSYALQEKKEDGSVVSSVWIFKTATTPNGDSEEEAKNKCVKACEFLGNKCVNKCEKSCSIIGGIAEDSTTPAPIVNRMSGHNIGEVNFTPIYSNPTESLGGVGEGLYDSIGQSGTIFQKLYSIAIWFAVILAVIFIIRGGVTMAISSFGNEGQYSKAKSEVKNAVIGLLLAVGSYVILNTINPAILNLSLLKDVVIITKEADDENQITLESEYTGMVGPSFIGIPGGNIVQIAGREVGNYELPKGTNSGTSINKYFLPAKPGDFWCSFFATWVYAQAGIAEIGKLPSRGSSLAVRDYFFSKNGQTTIYISLQQVLSGQGQPQPGDMIFFDRGPKKDPPPPRNIGGNGHIGIVESYDPSTKTVSTIEGNVSDMVKRNKHRLEEMTCQSITKCIFGFGRMKSR